MIYAPGGTFSVSSSHSLDYETKEEKVDSFYDELRDHANTAEHLIENADGINPAYLTNTAKSGIAVDVTNQMHRRLLKGDFGALRESKETISLSNVASLVENDKAVLDKVKSFDELMLLSKLLGDYSRLYRINNSRLLAALLLNLNLDLAPLNGTDREGRILKGALTGDSSIVGDRIVLSGNFYENMSKIKQLLGDLSTPVESDYLSEYFWYKVSIGEYEDVADLKVNDTRIQQYKDGFRQINELTAKLNTVVAPSGIGKFTRPPIGMSRPQQAQNALRMAPKSPVMAPRSPASVPGRPLPKSPVMGSSQQRPIGQGSQPQTRPLPSKPMTPAFGTRPIGQNRPVMPGRPGIGGMGKTPFMNKPMTPPFGQKSESATNRESVFREFSILVEQVKQQVATKNSILINQKKTRFLNGLATYNSVDSATITDEVAGAMESIVQRMKNIDSRLKTDLDAMGVNKTVWLQSLVELIKIGY
ncbi:hypothetical protein ECANGB1_1747 [Enterospora canceri]|uniref:Uncharacterized protein n=1 Tax=Enterospora canceri TaxID=1081671 RepID=A0A1Y1S5K3_9MICR|nr:hypothetical protein ECANGB1_1747 [Enterospora canceri]